MEDKKKEREIIFIFPTYVILELPHCSTGLRTRFSVWLYNIHSLKSPSSSKTSFLGTGSKDRVEHREQPSLTQILSDNIQPYLHLLPLGIETVLQFLEFPFQVLNSLPVPQTLHLGHFESSFCNLLFSTYKSAVRQTTTHHVHENARQSFSRWSILYLKV